MERDEDESEQQVEEFADGKIAGGGAPDGSDSSDGQPENESFCGAATHIRHKFKVLFTKANVVEYTFRTLLLCVGLFIMSLGVALSIQANLGTSPVSSVPTVLYYISGLSVGVTTMIVNTVIVLLQVVLLRRRFKVIQLLQIPVSIVFGLLCDLSLDHIVCGVVPAAYWQQWLVCAAGIVLVAAGVSLEVAANVVTLAGEGLALTMSKLFPKVKFGYMKVICDCSLMIIAVALSLIFLHGLEGVREGTVAAAVFVGLIAKLFNKATIPVANRLFASLYRCAAKPHDRRHHA